METVKLKADMSEEMKEAADQHMQPFVAKSAKIDPNRMEEDEEKVNLRGLKLFTANLSVLILLFIAAFSYSYGVIRMIEKKFALSSLKTGEMYFFTVQKNTES